MKSLRKEVESGGSMRIEEKRETTKKVLKEDFVEETFLTRVQGTYDVIVVGEEQQAVLRLWRQQETAQRCWSWKNTPFLAGLSLAERSAIWVYSMYISLIRIANVLNW